MGVGTYSSDFNGTGGTFIVGPAPTGDEKAYEAYVADVGEDSASSYDDWLQAQYDDYNRELVEAIEGIGRELKLPIHNRRGFQADGASFDRKFIGIIDGDTVEVGWRSWQTDFIIGVGPARNWADRVTPPRDPDAQWPDVVETFAETGRAPSNLADEFADARMALQNYVRIRLMQEGFGCQYKTSSYTSSSYELPENVDAVLSDLAKRLQQSLDHLNQPAAKFLAEATFHERFKTAKQLSTDSNGEFKPRLMVVVYEASTSMILVQEPDTDTDTLEYPAQPQVAAYLASISNEQWSAVPLVDETRALFEYLQHKADIHSFVVTADEYARIKDEDCIFEEADGARIILASALAEASSPAAR